MDAGLCLPVFQELPASLEMADEIYFLENGRVVSVENSRGMVVEDEKGTSAESGEGSI